MISGKVLDKRPFERTTPPTYCTACVNSSWRWGLTFDENGVCDACQWAKLKFNEINWDAREQELVTLLDKHRSRDGRFDVLVPSSGGKDSGYVAHELKHRYGMHPLCVSWSPGMYTPIGWENLSAMRMAGFDHIIGFQDGELHRVLTRLGFDLVGDTFWPWHYGMRVFPIDMAVKYEIPILFYGDMTRVEYGGGKDYWHVPTEACIDKKRSYWLDKGIDTLVEEGLEMGLLETKDLAAGLQLYRLPPLEKVESLGLEIHYYSYYRKWIPQENYYYAQEHCGLQANPERTEGTYSKFASLDDKLDGLHYYLQFIKYGFGRCTSDASHEIREGYLTRPEGVRLVQKYDGEFPIRHFKECLDYMRLTEEEGHAVIDKFRPELIWEKRNGEWRLKYQVCDL